MIAYLNGINYFRQPFAQMAELVDALVSNTSGVKTRAGSSPALGTKPSILRAFFIYCNTYGKKGKTKTSTI